MEPQSPPKRMTRARAAAKGTEPSTSKTATAAAKTKVTRKVAVTASTTATKRKTRSDDIEDDMQDDEDDFESLPAVVMKATRATRGRVRKTAEEPAPEEAPAVAAPRAARGRPKKTAEPAKEDSVRTTRTTRAKKPEDESEAESTKKTTRTRVTATAPPALTKPAAKSAVKKTVKFEEPEKENIAPPVAAKAKAAGKTAETATGLRARPVRRPAAASSTSRATRTTKETTASETREKPRPLSPKKITQLSLGCADSDDELAMDDQDTLKPMMRSPVKPPANIVQPINLPSLSKAEPVVFDHQEPAPNVIIGSPARRPPPSPFKDTMKSPAKRLEGLPSLGQPAHLELNEGTSLAGQMKVSLLQSPAKRPHSPVKGSVVRGTTTQETSAPSFKGSLLSSPAKRPMSPVKSFKATKAKGEDFLSDSSAIQPLSDQTLTVATAAHVSLDAGSADLEDELLEQPNQEVTLTGSPTRLRFPGRLSAVLPRHADPALKKALAPPAATATEGYESSNTATEPSHAIHMDVEYSEAMTFDMDSATADAEDQEAAPVPSSTPKQKGPRFGLRDKELEPYNGGDSDSEDDAASPKGTRTSYEGVPATPCPPGSSRTPRGQMGSQRTRSSGRSTAKRVRTDDKFGFTPLASQMNAWTAGPSPLKTGIHTKTLEPEVVERSIAMDDAVPSTLETSHLGNTFFEDAMSSHPTEAVEESDGPMEDVQVPADSEIEQPEFNDISITEEDVALAAEAHEMSLMEPERVEEVVGSQNLDDSLSDASQEYGDENAIPIDPALRDPSVPPVTPQRRLHREFHTVSKVPLKPADESSAGPKIKKRGHSISRLPSQRPTHGLTRNATVISYSPMKHKADSALEVPQDQERAASVPPTTPTKSEAGWSTTGTPARTPRGDLNPALLRGAVVFVDVHTSEGADASGIFVELLSQMGARCVKHWSWNPSHAAGDDGASKIGITHIVYKDGGKRTLEKVRQSKGVVQCVGVSWVLE